MNLENYRVGVINEGRFEPTWFWNRKAYTYHVTRPTDKKRRVTYVPYEVAREHWGIKIQGDRVVRDTDPEYFRGTSCFDDKLSGHCFKKDLAPKIGEVGYQFGQHQYVNDTELEDWFTNKVHFVLKEVPQSMVIEE